MELATLEFTYPSTMVGISVTYMAAWATWDGGAFGGASPRPGGNAPYTCTANMAFEPPPGPASSAGPHTMCAYAGDRLYSACMTVTIVYDPTPTPVSIVVPTPRPTSAPTAPAAAPPPTDAPAPVPSPTASAPAVAQVDLPTPTRQALPDLPAPRQVATRAGSRSLAIWLSVMAAALAAALVLLAAGRILWRRRARAAVPDAAGRD